MRGSSPVLFLAEGGEGQRAAPAPLKKDWVLNQEAFDALLVSLDRNPNAPEQKYEQIRHALITFFECRGSRLPKSTPTTRSLASPVGCSRGKDIQVENPASYFYGVARNVLKEYWESRGRAPVSLESAAAHTWFSRSSSPAGADVGAAVEGAAPRLSSSAASRAYR